MPPPSRSRRRAGDRTGSSSGAQVVGLKEFRKELRQLENPKEWSKALGQIHREIAKTAAAKIRQEALAEGGPPKHFAKAIRGYGTVANARIGVANPAANAAFWGAKQRSGWYLAPRYNSSRGQQHERWVGNTWDVAVAGQGPYVINDSLADQLPEIIDTYGDRVEALARRAFPD